MDISEKSLPVLKKLKPVLHRMDAVLKNGCIYTGAEIHAKKFFADFTDQELVDMLEATKVKSGQDYDEMDELISTGVQCEIDSRMGGGA